MWRDGLAIIAIIHSIYDIRKITLSRTSSANFSHFFMRVDPIETTIHSPNRSNKRQGIDCRAIFSVYACVGVAENITISTTYRRGMVVAIPLSRYQMRMAPHIVGWRKIHVEPRTYISAG
jgi:hypothetical protein